jgi:hypothetical protein
VSLVEMGTQMLGRGILCVFSLCCFIDCCCIAVRRDAAQANFPNHCCTMNSEIVDSESMYFSYRLYIVSRRKTILLFTE